MSNVKQFYYATIVGICVLGFVVLPLSTDLGITRIGMLVARAIGIMVLLYIVTVTIKAMSGTHEKE